MSNPRTSLDLLLDERTKSTWSPPWTSSAQFLERKSRTILENLEPPNSQNPGYAMIDNYHIAEFPSDGGEATPTPSVLLHGRDNYLRFRAKLASANPGLTLKVLDSTSKLDDDAGKATVYVTCYLLNYKSVDMKPRESVVLMEWIRRKGDRWICVKSKVVHGHSHLPIHQESGSTADIDHSESAGAT